MARPGILLRQEAPLTMILQSGWQARQLVGREDQRIFALGPLFSFYLRGSLPSPRSASDSTASEEHEFREQLR